MFNRLLRFVKAKGNRIVHVLLDVQVKEETVWLTQDQMAKKSPFIILLSESLQCMMKKDLLNRHAIYSPLFNKSVTLHLEAFLINHFSAEPDSFVDRDFGANYTVKEYSSKKTSFAVVINWII